jgi:hypothetical protein
MPTSSLIPDTAKYDLALQLQACQSHSRRNGKVARLPTAIRDQINQMMDDGLPYKIIIEKLGPAGQHVNEDNLSNWRLGGYQDYLKAQVIKDRARIQTEAAAGFVRDTNHPDPAKLKQVCANMALLHYFDTIMEHGEQCARDSLNKNPAKFITLINACCNMANSNIAIQEQKSRRADLAARSKNSRTSPAAQESTAPQLPPPLSHPPDAPRSDAPRSGDAPRSDDPARPEPIRT